jgi:hypothetical protein
MELGAELPQRRVELRREHQHGEARLQGDPSVDEADPDRDGDEGDAQRRGQLEHGAREEADAQRRDRRAPVAIADVRERRALGAAPVVGAQRGQPADDVEEVRRQQPQREPVSPGPVLRVPADQPHEERHERQRQQHQERRIEVDRRHPREHGDRDDRREHHLREVPAEVAAKRVDALHGGRRDLASLDAVESGGLSAQSPLDEREAEVREHRRRGPVACDLEAPREKPARREREHEQHELWCYRSRRCTVEEPRDDRRQQRRLDEHERRGPDPERGIHDEEDARASRTPEQTPVETAHRIQLPETPAARHRPMRMKPRSERKRNYENVERRPYAR